MNSIEKFDENKWKELEVKLPKPANSIGLFAINHETIILIGGSREKGAHTNEAFEFNLNSYEITTKPELNLTEPDYFASQSAIRIDNKLYFMGSLTGYHTFEENTQHKEIISYK